MKISTVFTPATQQRRRALYPGLFIMRRLLKSIKIEKTLHGVKASCVAINGEKFTFDERSKSAARIVAREIVKSKGWLNGLSFKLDSSKFHSGYNRGSAKLKKTMRTNGALSIKYGFINHDPGYWALDFFDDGEIVDPSKKLDAENGDYWHEIHVEHMGGSVYDIEYAHDPLSLSYGKHLFLGRIRNEDEFWNLMHMFPEFDRVKEYQQKVNAFTSKATSCK